MLSKGPFQILSQVFEPSLGFQFIVTVSRHSEGLKLGYEARASYCELNLGLGFQISESNVVWSFKLGFEALITV